MSSTEETTDGCDPAALDALVAGELDGVDAARLREHVRACAACTLEVELLEAEAQLFRARTPAPPVVGLWPGVERKLVPPRPRWSWMALWTTAPALLVLLLVMRSAPTLFSKTPVDTVPRAGVPRPAPSGVLDSAERDYAAAVSTLEARYQAERTRLPRTVTQRVDAELARGRGALAEARREAGSDDDARWMVLDRYSDYLHSLHSLLLDLEVD